MCRIPSHMVLEHSSKHSRTVNEAFCMFKVGAARTVPNTGVTMFCRIPLMAAKSGVLRTENEQPAHIFSRPYLESKDKFPLDSGEASDRRKNGHFPRDFPLQL